MPAITPDVIEITRKALHLEDINKPVRSDIAHLFDPEIEVKTMSQSPIRTEFPIHTIETAPENSKAALQGLNTAFGFVPNIAAAMATSPVLIKSLVGLFQNVHGGTFSEPQIQTLLLTNAVTNSCTWAVAFHSFLALKEGLDPNDVEAIRKGHTPNDPKLGALSVLAKTLIEKRGRLEDQDIDSFLKAGFTKDNLLEVIAVSAASTITNYTGSVTMPPLEAAFQEHSWAA